MPIDQDLINMTPEQLREECQKIRDAVRKHRDSSGHDLCWFVPELWDVLPEKGRPKPYVPDWEEFLHGCVSYRKSLDETS
jgi:hypothetical protein